MLILVAEEEAESQFFLSDKFLFLILRRPTKTSQTGLKVDESFPNKSITKKSIANDVDTRCRGRSKGRGRAIE